jgi:predicted nucleotidyltransferase
MNLFGLTERDVLTITGILNKYPSILRVHIFGSRAKGNFKTGSDIDLAIMNEGFASEELIRIKNDFSESSLPFFVDIISYPELTHLELKEHIDRVGKLFYNKNS